MLFRTKFPPGTSLAKHFWYPILRSYFFLIFARLAYWRIHRENKPTFSGRYIWASSHSNFFSDVVVAGFEPPIVVRFLAKSSLFVFPMKWISEFCGALPLVRLGDNELGMSRAAQNKKTFEVAIQSIQAGWPIAIFPEGTSLVVPGLALPLKPGVAKLALSAEESEGFSLGLKIFPVGLEYGSRGKIGSGLTIRYGRPLVVADFKEQYLNNESLGVKALMEKLTNEMISIYPHFLSDEQLNQGKKLFTSGLVSSKHEAAQIFLARANQPGFWAKFKEALLKFEEASKEAAIPLGAWGQVRRWKERPTHRRIARGLYLILGIPFALLEFLNDVVAEKCISVVVGYLAVDETEVMTVRFLSAHVIAPLVYFFQYWLVKKYIFGLALHRSDLPCFVFYLLGSMSLWYGAVHWRRLLTSWTSLWFFWRANEDGRAYAKAAYEQVASILT